MLLGRPPFETTNLKETYRCIREARYSLPSSLMPPAKHLITSMLSKNPEDRPSLDDIVRHDFFLLVSSHLGFVFVAPSVPNAGADLLDNHLCASCFLRASPQRGFQQAVVTQFLTSIYQAQPRISSRRQRRLSLGARRKKRDILTHTVSIYFMYRLVHTQFQHPA